MGRMRLRRAAARLAAASAAAAAVALAVLPLTTCSNPVDLVEAVTVEVMKGNDRYLEVVGTTPAAGAPTVNPGTRIRLTFDRDVDMNTVDSSTISINKSGGGAVTWTSIFDPQTKVLSIKPATILDDSADYTVAVIGVAGADGSALLETVAWQFHTIMAPAGQVVVTSSNADSLPGFTNTDSVLVSIVNPNGLAEDFTVASSEAALDNPEANGGGWTWELDIGASVGFSLPAATQGTQYAYVVIRDDSPLQYSAVIDAGIILDTIAPATPSVAGATPTTSLKPTWSWSAQGGGNGTYRFQLDSTAGAWTTTTSLSHTPGSSLVLGNHVLYVQERDNAGNWSSSGSHTIGIAPLAPTGVTASDNTSTAQVAVSWTASAGAITGYQVYRSTSAMGTYSLVGTVGAVTSYNDTSASAGTVYYYKVRAIGTDGLPSADSGYDAGFRKMSVPSDVSATDNASTSYVTVSWSATTGASSYYIERSTDNVAFSSLGSATGLSYNDTTGVPGTLYYYRLRAYSSSYYSDYSSSNSGVRKIAAPVNLAATDGTASTGVDVSWSAASGATGYRVYRSTSSTSGYVLIATPATSSYSDTGVSSTSTKYYYKVEAYGSAGTSYLSDLSAYDEGYRGLSYVTGLSARTYMTYNYIQLSWDALAGATGYMIYQYNSSTANWDYYAYTTGTTANLAPASYNTTMYYKIRAYDTSTSYPGVWTPSYVGARRLGLTGYWAFNNAWTDTGLADSTTPDNFTITSGSPSFSTTRKFGTYSASFSTYSQKITNSDYTFMSSDRKQVSVSYWVYPTKLSSGLMWSMACGDFNVGFNGSTVTMTVSLPSTNSAYATLDLNAWNHIVGTYDGANIKIYKNGVLAQTTAHAGTVPGYTTALNVYSGTSSNYWTGYLDELRIYNVTLSLSQVVDLYNFD